MTTKRDDEIRAATVGPLTALNAPVTLVDYDAAWPIQFAAEAAKIRRALGDRIMVLEHVGSTSVPGLAAKPIIDILLVVADSALEAGYVPALEAAGYVLRIREPNWHEHRVIKGSGPSVNLHVFSPDCPETERMLAFRDRIRTVKADRLLYEATKRELAARTWAHIQNYADAKSAVVEEILARAKRG